MKSHIKILVIIDLIKSISYFINFYYSLENYIQSTIQRIPLKKGAENLCGNEDISMNQNISKEYQFFENCIDYDEEHYNHLHPGDMRKDRYSDIKSYSHNIVTINDGQNYINASPINIICDKYFISTQGPKEETIDDFWTMVFEHECNIVVMLCNLEEGGRPKCAKYWDKNSVKKFEIKTITETKKQDYKIREIIISKNKKEKKVYQIHYTAWPDHGVPNVDEGKVFEPFIEIMQFIDKPEIKGNGPIVVHCSAGVGRTGTFISMYYLEKEIMRQIKDEVSEIKFSIFNLVRKLKEMRLYLVQTESQYRFIYEFVKYLLNKNNV